LRVVVLCATDRGLRALKCLRALAPDADFIVASFPETAHEPRYLDAIEAFCQDERLEFFCQTNVSQHPLGSRLQESFDLLFCFSWRYMVKSEVYERAKRGAFVIHDSLLPKYRGFSPALWAMINGEPKVGVTLFEMAEEVDSGRIVGQQAIPVLEDDDIGTIREKGTVATLRLLKRHFPALATGTAELVEQDDAEATYTCKWIPDDARIDWKKSRKEILNLIRATTKPYTGAFTFLNGEKLTIWKAETPKQKREYASRAHGAICSINPDGSVGVLTGDGELLLMDVSYGEAQHQNASEVVDSLSFRLGAR